MKILILFTITFLIYSCTYHSVSMNGETDNKDGKACLNKFYAAIGDEKFDSVDSTVGDSLKQLAGSHGIS